MKYRTPYGGTSAIAQGLKLTLDPWIVGPALLIFLMSLASLFTVVYHPTAFEINPRLAWDFSTPFVKHLIWGIMGIGAMIALSFRKTELIEKKTVFIYLAGLALLVFVLVFGIKVRNIRAWISLGFLTFQPSELVKIAVVIALARYLSRPERVETPIRSLLAAAILVAVPALLVLKQPDMGTVIVYLSLLLTVPFAAGLPSRYLVLILISCGLLGLRLLLGLAAESLNILPAGVLRMLLTDAAPARMIVVILAVAGTAVVIGMKSLRMRHALIVWLFCILPAASWAGSFSVAESLKPYQKLRLLTFIAPQLDPKGSGYNIIQSQIAFGSGGLFGKGFSGATQSQLGFLPERQTDFIFSVIGEIFGFAGVAVVAFSFLAIIVRLFMIAGMAKSRFGMLIAVGTATILLTHVAVNMGMAIGIMPIMGIPLPLASYGGTAMVTVFSLLGLSLAVEREARLG